METMLVESPPIMISGVAPIEKRAYFEGLCWSLLETGIPGAACLACGKGEQSGTLFQCENCGAPFHGHCASEIALREYEAFPGIFRCKKCDCLINTESKKIIIPSTRQASKPAKQEKAEPVRIVIKTSGSETPEPAPGVSFTVKAMPEPGSQKPAAAKPPGLSMRPPPSIKPAPERQAISCDEDIKVIGSDECLTVGAGDEGESGKSDGIVIIEEKAMSNPASFWKKDKE